MSEPKDLKTLMTEWCGIPGIEEGITHWDLMKLEQHYQILSPEGRKMVDHARSYRVANDV